MFNQGGGVLSGVQWKRVVLVCIALVGMVVAAWMIFSRPASKQAFVNASVITVRAPIPGTLVIAAEIELGKIVSRSQLLGRVAGDLSNPRVSELRVLQQQLIANATDLEQREISLALRIVDREQQLARYRMEGRRQQILQARYAQAKVEQANADLQRLRTLAELADVEVRRATELFEKGYLSKAGFDRSVAGAKASGAQARAQRALLTQSEASFEASRNGLQLDGPRALSEPDQQDRQLNRELVDLRQQARDITTQRTATRTEADRVHQELVHQQLAVLEADRPSVVWSLDAQSGEALQAGAPVMQLIDCKDVWVDAFFDESDVRDLKVGGRAEVSMPHDARRWAGTIETIRSGTGRVTVGQYVANPPPEIARRQLPVKVVTVRVRVDWKGALQPGQYCFAGRSVEVSI